MAGLATTRGGTGMVGVPHHPRVLPKETDSSWIRHKKKGNWGAKGPVRTVCANRPVRTAPRAPLAQSTPCQPPRAKPSVRTAPCTLLVRASPRPIQPPQCPPSPCTKPWL